MATLLGRKIGMTQYFTESGKVMPVTVIEAGPCFVVQKKTPKKEGYAAIQIGFDDRPAKRTNKPTMGHFRSSDVTPKRALREIRIPEKDLDKYNLGQELKADLFKEGEIVDVVGTSKGRGFTGVMKRYNFHGMKATHGTHEFFRHGGAIGQHSYPGEVFKGMKMPGHYGAERVTAKNLTVAKVEPDRNIVMVLGAVPGHRHSLVIIRTAKTGVQPAKG